MRVTSHQASFFPWIGYWNKVANADLHIVTAGVKFDYGGYQNRVMLGGSWLTLPVPRDARNQLLKDVRFDRDALPGVRKRLQQSCASKRCAQREIVEEILHLTFDLSTTTDFLVEFNLNAYRAVASVLGLSPHVAVDFEEPDAGLTKTENLLARIRRHASGQVTYLAGSGQLDYLDFNQWPNDFRLLIQTPKEGLDPGSVLQLIAATDGAIRDVQAAADWKEVSLDQTDTGHRSTLGRC